MTVYVFKYVLSSVCIFMQNAAATCNHQGCINYPGPHHFCNGTDSPYISYDLLWDIWGVSIPYQVMVYTDINCSIWRSI